jgi:hypothetical protein
MHTTLNHIEEVEDESESKEDTTVDIYMDNRSTVYMFTTFKDTKNARHIRRIFHFVKQGVQDEWHTLVWISNQSMVADGMTKVLAKKDLLHKIQYCTCSPILTKTNKTDLQEGFFALDFIPYWGRLSPPPIS